MPSIAPPFMREDAMSRMCNRSNLVVVRTLGAGAQGSVSLLRTADGIEVACKTFKARTADEHKLFLAGGITSRVEAEVRIQQLLAASNLTSQRVAPRVLASCVGAGRPFILSEAGSGGWLSRDLAASYCPPHSLDQVNRSVPQGLAPYCKDLGRLLTRMDEHGLLQIDWQVGHMMRVDQHLMAVDFGRASLYSASLPRGANWCQLAAVMSKLMSRTGVPLISTEMQHFQMPQGVVDIVTRNDDRCLVRCLRDFGTLQGPDGPLRLGDRGAAEHCVDVLDAIEKKRANLVVTSAPMDLFKCNTNIGPFCARWQKGLWLCATQNASSWRLSHRGWSCKVEEELKRDAKSRPAALSALTALRGVDV